MFAIRNRKIFFTISGLLVLLSVAAMFVWGFNFSIEFTGGSIVEVLYPEGRPAQEELAPRLNQFPVSSHTLQPSGENSYIIRTEELSEPERDALLGVLSFDGEREIVEERFSNIGPVIGEELRNKSMIGILIVVLSIILFVAFSFRKVSKPVSSFKYGLIAIVALIHDISIPTGVFILLGFFLGVQIDILFVTALLAILGFSVNDTIVVFDRVRENLREKEELDIKESFEETVGRSLEQTYARSINTSLTTLVVLLSLLFLGGETTTFFALTLVLGVIAGTYSSIFLASPLLVTWSGKEGEGN